MSDSHRSRDTNISRLEVIRRIRALERIPPPPQQQQRLLAAIADPDLELDALADLINQCPPVAARVMGVARSAFFSSGTPVRGVRDAVVRVLGLRLVADLVQCVALSSPLEVGRCPAFEPLRYWMSAVVTATVARRIARDAVRMDADSRRAAYLAGLLHNLGVLALVHLDPEAMSKVFVESEIEGTGSFADLVAEHLGISHTEAGERLAAAWGLPPDIRAAILYQHQPSYRGDHWMLALLIGGAAGLATVLLDPESVTLRPVPDLECLGLESERIGECLSELESSVRSLGELAQQLA